MEARINWQLRIENAGFNTKLLEEQFQTIGAIYVGNEYNAFPFDQLEFENDKSQ